VASALASPALAQTPAQTPATCSAAEVDAEVAAANDDRRAGRGLVAVDRLSALFDRCPSPRVEAQWGLAAQSLSRWRDAYTHLRAALQAQADPWIETRRPVLTRGLQEVAEHLPRLSPQSNVPGAVLWVDGVAVGPLPLPEPYVLPQGVATLEVRAPGHQSQQQAVSLPDNTVFRTLFTLVPPAPVTATASATEGARIGSEGATEDGAGSPRVGPPSGPVPGPARGGTLRTVGTVGLVAGGVMLGVGVLGVVLQRARVDTFTQANCALQGDVVQGGGVCQAEYDAGRRMETLATAGFVAGGVLAVGGLMLRVFAPRAAERATARGVACGPSLGGAGVACVGRF